MKICIQSGTPLGTSDIYKPYYESLKRHAHRVCRSDTVVEFPNLGKSLPGAARSRTHLHFVAHETIRSAMRAEAEGYDVFLTQCLDLGFNELREMVNIPVVFMTQATLAYYSQLAPNFAFLVNSQRLHYFFQEIAERYKVKERRDPLAIGIKTAELMTDLERAGVRRYSAGPWAVPPDEVRALLSKEFGNVP